MPERPRQAPDYQTHPDEVPFNETKDYYERQARYRLTTHDAWQHIRAVLEQADALDDPQTRANLDTLRADLAHLDLPERAATDDLDPVKNKRPHSLRDDNELARNKAITDDAAALAEMRRQLDDL
jgi:hypothetical protein